MTWRETVKHTSLIDEALNLKICDLCGALNLVTDSECVVCRWHGHFESRQEVVRIALEFHVQRQMATGLRSYPDETVMPEVRLRSLGARIAAIWSGLQWRLTHRRI